RCLVIPRSKESACFTDRKIRLPLRLGGIRVGVQLERRTEGHTAVGGTNIVYVARIAAVFLRIHQANHVIKRGRLAPAHVPPVSRTAVHRTEEARTAAARTDEGWASISVGPGRTAVSRAENLVISDAAAARSTPVAAGFVHACDVQVAC